LPRMARTPLRVGHAITAAIAGASERSIAWRAI
jgi:hypothetical protein